MSEPIRELARIQVPHELLRQIDMNELLSTLRANFDKLDNFKHIRDEHNNRGTFKKVWDWIRRDNTLQNAQLDAVELQASFSKNLSQLMIISIMQARESEQQQQKLVTQQIKIGEQTERIENQASEIAQQQVELKEQNVKVKKLVEEYFDLKGLTVEGATKLIAIANDVRKTRDDLLQSVSHSVSNSSKVVEGTKRDLMIRLSETEYQIGQTVMQACQEVSESNARLRREVVDRIDQSTKSVDETKHELRQSFQQLRDDLDVFIQATRSSVSDIDQRVAQTSEALRRKILEVVGEIKDVRELHDHRCGELEKAINESTAAQSSRLVEATMDHARQVETLAVEFKRTIKECQVSNAFRLDEESAVHRKQMERLVEELDVERRTIREVASGQALLVRKLRRLGFTVMSFAAAMLLILVYVLIFKH